MFASASGYSTGTASMSATVSASKIVPMIALVSICVHKLKGLNLGEKSFHLRIQCGVGMIGKCKFDYVLGDGGCAFFLSFCRRSII